MSGKSHRHGLICTGGRHARATGQKVTCSNKVLSRFGVCREHACKLQDCCHFKLSQHGKARYPGCHRKQMAHGEWCPIHWIQVKRMNWESYERRVKKAQEDLEQRKVAAQRYREKLMMEMKEQAARFETILTQDASRDLIALQEKLEEANRAYNSRRVPAHLQRGRSSKQDAYKRMAQTRGQGLKRPRSVTFTNEVKVVRALDSPRRKCITSRVTRGAPERLRKEFKRLDDADGNKDPSVYEWKFLGT